MYTVKNEQSFQSIFISTDILGKKFCSLICGLTYLPKGAVSFTIGFSPEDFKVYPQELHQYF